MRLQMWDNEYDQTGQLTIKADAGQLGALSVLAAELAQRHDITVEGTIHTPPPPAPPAEDEPDGLKAG